MFDNFRKALSSFISKNSIGDNFASRFLRYGPQGTMAPNWSHVTMSDQDHYTGYGYAAIRNRANKVGYIATDNVKTKSDKKNFVHPYLDLIENSPNFTPHQFWYSISTYLDLEGVYYLMAVRNKEADRYGKVLSFKLLNPYNVTRVVSKNEEGQLVVGGYIESRNGFTREIPPQLIIEMRELNPFSDETPYAMTDAARESQFSLKTSGDYTRHAMRNNINAPGIITTDKILDQEKFANFRARVKEHVKGEPIFANGQGAITWQDMQLNLKDSALTEISEINRDVLFSVSGQSKTLMGIEQSGTTRETSKVQQQLSIEDHILPRIQLILDALNLDYRSHAPRQDEGRKEVCLVVDNPTAVDQDAEIKDIKVKSDQLDLYQTLVNKGVENQTAVQYINGEVGLEALKIKKVEIAAPTDTKKTEADNQIEDVKKNSVSPVDTQTASLQNTIINLDQLLVGMAIDRIPQVVKNDIFSLEELFTKAEIKTAIAEITGALIGFYGIITLLRGNEIMDDRSGQYSLPGVFSLTKKIKDFIKKNADKVGKSHVQTVTTDIYDVARKAALDGKSVSEIQSLLRKEFTGSITNVRAKTIAVTETNKAFTGAQLSADEQFVQQNDLKAFKKWRTNSANPCPMCVSLSREPAIPLSNNFKEVGDKIHAGDEVFEINFEDLKGGNAHPNCQCDYELIIE